MVPELVTERLLVMSFVDGFKVDDAVALNSHGADRSLIVKHVTRSYAHQIFVDGFFSADPHPGNILVDIESLRPVSFLGCNASFSNLFRIIVLRTSNMLRLDALGVVS